MFVIFSSTSRRCLVFSNTPKGEKDARREQQIELKGKRVTTGMEKVILNALTDRSFFNFLLHIAPYPPFPFIVPIPSYEKPEASVERMMNMPIWESWIYTSRHWRVFCEIRNCTPSFQTIVLKFSYSKKRNGVSSVCLIIMKIFLICHDFTNYFAPSSENPYRRTPCAVR